MRWLIALLASVAPALAAPGTYLEVCSPGSCRALDGSTQPAGTVINRVVVDPATFSKPGVAYVPDDRRPIYSPATAAPPLPSLISVLAYDADPTGVTDSTAAFNAAASALRANTAATTLLIPPGQYLITSPINLTGLDRNGLTIVGHGAKLLGKTNGKPVVDMIGTRWARVKGLHIQGDKFAAPSIGIQIGRSTTTACSNGNWQDVVADGWYSFTAIYVMACETTAWYSVQGRNNALTAGTHGIVLDGLNHWNVGSDFVSLPAQDSMMGFNEPVFVNLFASTLATDDASSPLWISRSQGLRIINGYAAGWSKYQTIVHGSLDSADLELHTENLSGNVAAEFFLTGGLSITLDGWRYRTQAQNAPVVYLTDVGVTSVAMRGAVPIETPHGGAAVFADPALWTVSGRYALPPGSTAWNLGCDRFAGIGMTGSAVSFCGDGSGLTGVTASVPSAIQAASISNSGGVSSVTLPTQAVKYNIEGWCFHNGTQCQPQYSHLLPTVTIAAPPAGGAQARAAAAMVLTNTMMDAYLGSGSNLPAAGGSGWTVGNVATLVGGACSVQPTVRVASVAAGVVTGWLVQQAGLCTAIPPEPIATTGAGSGLTLAGLTWQVGSITVTDPGSGYASPPAVTVQPTNFNNGPWPAFTGTVTSALALNAGTVTVNGVLVPQGGVSCASVSTSTMRVTNGIVTTC